MTPISPVLTEEFVPNEVIYAKDQPEYNPLPTLRCDKGLVLSRWQPSDSEREAIALGADVYLSVWTFNQPLQPLYMEVISCSSDLGRVSERMGLLNVLK